MAARCARGWFVGPLVASLVGCAASAEPIQGSRPADEGADAALADGAADGAFDAAVDDGPAPDDGEPPADTSPVDAASEAAPEADADVPPPPVDCTTGVFGPSSYSLVGFQYVVHTADCTSSLCSEFVTFDTTCTLTLQVEDVPASVVLDAADCDVLTRWLTSDLLVHALRDMVTCAYGKDGPSGAPYESTEMQLADGAANKKTFNCSQEPFPSHRKCVQAFRAKYFPGK